MSIDSIFFAAGILFEVGVISLLLFRGAWRSFPIFLIYNAYALIGDASVYGIRHFYPRGYALAYLILILVDAALSFGVLIELGTSILRPLRGSLPRRAPLMVACLILAIGAGIWPFAAFHSSTHLRPIIAAVARIQQDTSILRILVFLALVAFSQSLAIGWRDREFQIAAGLGFYSLVSLAVAMVHEYLLTWSQYRHWDRVVVASYLCSLIYWIVSLAQKERARREFTPQMQQILLAVAGHARSTRAAMEPPKTDETREKMELE